MEIKVKDLMVLERLLLEIDTRFKFDLNFNDAYKLYELLKKVGRITSYAFLIQDEYADKIKDSSKLLEYHKMVMNSNVEYNQNETIEFIEKISESMENEEFNKILNGIKFW